MGDINRFTSEADLDVRVRNLRAQIAIGTRWNKPDVHDLQCELRGVLLERFASESLECDTPPTKEQVRWISALLLAHSESMEG